MEGGFFKMKTTDMLEELIKTARTSEVDLRKFDGGNTSAGKRARKVMQSVRKRAKAIRVEIQRMRKERKIKNDKVE
jgi:hypothetical protein